MCGIAGILSFNRTGVKQDDLKQMTNAIRHRGPDGEGFWISDDSRVGFGHRRLAIIDLSEAGSQPMHYLDQRYTITYNGEIYNYLELRDQLELKGYAFKSQTDTEVLIAAFAEWGEDFLLKLDGMFAFAIWDREREELFCARDRFGEKPFYYFHDGDRLIFASEIKAFWALGIERNLDHRMVFNHLFYDAYYDPNDLAATFYKGIRCLKHSHLLKVRDGQLREASYYQLDPENINYDLSFDEAIIEFKDLLQNSIDRRLRSDVMVGSSLSGGLDSSTIVRIINEIKHNKGVNQKTFSAYFEGFEKNERNYIDQLVKELNLDSKMIDLGEDRYEDIVDQVVHAQDEPFSSLSIMAQFKIMRLAADDQVKVLIDGQGADETLAGYHWYFNSFFQDIFNRDIRLWQKEYSAYLNLQSGNQINQVRTSNFISLAAKRFFPSLSKVFRTSSTISTQKLSPKAMEYYQAYRSEKFDSVPIFKSLNEELYHDSFLGPLQTLLKFADRNSMHHSIEVRLPFLDPKLVEFIFSLPPEMKIHHGWTKFLMRKAYSDQLPADIAWRREKVGYEPPPLSDLLKDKWKFLNHHYQLDQ